MKAISLSRYSFHKDALLSAPKEERHLFLLAGHLLNELAILFRLLSGSLQYESEDKTLDMGSLATQMSTILYFISKVSEGWELVNERFTSSIQGKYFPDFPDENKQSHKRLEDYFKSRKSFIQKARNNFGFHNHDDQFLLLEAFNRFPGEEFYIFVSESPGLCLFHVSEVAIGMGLVRIVNENITTIDEYRQAYQRLIRDTVDVHKYLQDVLLAFQVIFMNRYLKDKSDITSIEVKPEIRFEDLNIPYFVYPPNLKSQERG